MNDRGRLVFITPSQARVVQSFMVDGATNPELARRLYLSEDTIKSHMKAVLKVTKCADRSVLAMALLRQEVVLAVPESQRNRDSYEVLVIR